MQAPQSAVAAAVTGRAPRWKVGLVLGLAGGISSLLLVPYVLAVSHRPPQTPGLPLPVAFAISWVQSTGVLFLLAWAGLALGQRLGLDAPFLRAWLSRGGAPRAQARWLVAVGLGVAAAAVIVLLDAVVFHGGMRDALAQAGRDMPRAARWKGALACFYGGIAEEVQLRLFLMTAVAWCLDKAIRPSSPRAVLVAANVVAALVFGAGHLPLAVQIFGLSAIVVVRTVVLNALGGVAFGALYARFGLEHAMVAHFCADVVLHVVVGG